MSSGIFFGMGGDILVCQLCWRELNEDNPPGTDQFGQKWDICQPCLDEEAEYDRLHPDPK